MTTITVRLADAVHDRAARAELARRWRRQHDGRATVLDMLDLPPTEDTWVRALHALLTPAHGRADDEAGLRELAPLFAHWPETMRVVPPALLGHVHERRALPEHLDALVYPRAGAVLRACRALRRPDGGLHDGDLAALASHPDLAGLTVLDIAHNRFTDKGIVRLAHSTTLTRLEHLDISRNELSPDALERVIEGPWRHTLHTLRVNRTCLGQALTRTSPPASWPLRHLALEGSQLAPASLARLAHAPCADTLEHLDISHNVLDTPALTDTLGAMPRLHTLVAAHIGIRQVELDEDVSPRRRRRRARPPVPIDPPSPVDPRLFEALRAADTPSLRHLDLTGNALGAELVDALARAPRLARLEHLALSLDDLETRTLADAIAPGWSLHTLDLRAVRGCTPSALHQLLARLAPLHTLRLRTARQAAHAAWIEALVDTPWLHQLVTLDLAELAPGRSGMQTLADAPLHGLTTLDLSATGLRAPSLSALAAGQGLSSLRHLDLSNNRLGPVGVSALARAPWASQLTHLHLRQCTLSDAGARALADSPLIDRLSHLDLSLNRLTDDGAVAITRALARRGPPCRLDLRGNPLTHAGRQAAHQAAGPTVELIL